MKVASIVESKFDTGKYTEAAYSFQQIFV
jgi:hypothetical protein